MNKIFFTLVAVCVVFNQYVRAQDEECQEDAKKLKASIKETMQSGETPCNDEYDLGRFQCADDESDASEKMDEFKAWMSEKSEDEQKAIGECAMEMIKKGIEKVKDEISEDCMDKIKEKMSKYSE